MFPGDKVHHHVSTPLPIRTPVIAVSTNHQWHVFPATLQIRESKFGQTRLAPLHSTSMLAHRPRWLARLGSRRC